MKTAKRASAPSSLAERIEALEAEADVELDRLAEAHRPPSVPAGWMRTNWLARGGGNVLHAYLAAAKELGL